MWIYNENMAIFLVENEILQNDGQWLLVLQGAKLFV